MILFRCERTSFLAAGFLKEGFSIWEAGADSGGKVGLGVWVVLFVCIWKVRPEPGERPTTMMSISRQKNLQVMSLET